MPGITSLQFAVQERKEFLVFPEEARFIEKKVAELQSGGLQRGFHSIFF